MKRLKRGVPHYSACLFLLAAFAAWPTAGWSQTASQTCAVKDLLQNWADQLQASWLQPIYPPPIVSTYADNAVLLPTCSNGPLVGHPAIEDYFKNAFLPLQPQATFDWDNAHCTPTFASGLYSFKVKNGQVLRGRYTYVFTGKLIAQHHSSLEPNPLLPQGCPSH